MRHSLALVASLLLSTLWQSPASPPVLLAEPAVEPAAEGAELLERAARWTARFERSLSGLLFRERYAQTWFDRGTRESKLEANVFLIKPSPDAPFVLYRDVYHANGRAITDHTDRLQKLLVENSRHSMSEARRLADASAAYNAGMRRINVNVPTMPLAYLAPHRLGALRIRGKAGDAEEMRGFQVVRVDVNEIGRPTLVRDGSRRNIPASSSYWIHPGSGAVLRAYVELVGRGHIDVRFALHETLSVWVPIQMTEIIHGVTGNAEYDRFERLTVATSEDIK